MDAKIKKTIQHDAGTPPYIYVKTARHECLHFILGKELRQGEYFEISILFFFRKYEKVQQINVRALGRMAACTFLTTTIARWCFAMLKKQPQKHRCLVHQAQLGLSPSVLGTVGEGWCTR